MPSSVDGARRKLERGEGLLRELEREVAAYWSRQPFRVVERSAPSRPQDAPNDPRVSFAVAVDERFPSEKLALILGDCVHNVRSALDYAIYAAVTAAGHEPSVQTMFPIWRKSLPPTVSQWQNAVRQRASGAGPAVMQRLMAMEPRQGGRDEALWALHELDIVDKHRLPIVAAGAYSAVELNFGRLFPNFPGEPMPDMWIALRPDDAFPVDDGFELFEATRSIVDRQTPRFRFDAALAEPESFRGVPLGEAIGRMLDSASEAVDAINASMRA